MECSKVIQLVQTPRQIKQDISGGKSGGCVLF